MYLTKVHVLFVRKVSGKIKMDSQIAKIVELGNTMIKRNAQQRLIVKLIATLDHTLYLTKVRVLFVRKVSGKIKMDSQLVAVVKLENITIKRNAQQKLIAKIVERENTMIKLEKLIVKLVRLVKNQQMIKKPVKPRWWCTQNGRVGNARMGVLIGGTS